MHSSQPIKLSPNYTFLGVYIPLSTPGIVSLEGLQWLASLTAPCPSSATWAMWKKISSRRSMKPFLQPSTPIGMLPGNQGPSSAPEKVDQSVLLVSKSWQSAQVAKWFGLTLFWVGTLPTVLSTKPLKPSVRLFWRCAPRFKLHPANHGEINCTPGL